MLFAVNINLYACVRIDNRSISQVIKKAFFCGKRTFELNFNACPVCAVPVNLFMENNLRFICFGLNHQFKTVRALF